MTTKKKKKKNYDYTATERKRSERQRKRDAGLVSKTLWLHPDLVEKAKKLEEKSIKLVDL